jgi:hypothetical protein
VEGEPPEDASEEAKTGFDGLRDWRREDLGDESETVRRPLGLRDGGIARQRE